MSKDTLATETSYYTLLFLDYVEKAKIYRNQILSYAFLLLALLFSSWYIFFKEPPVELYLQAKKEFSLLQKSLKENNQSSIDTLADTFPPLLQKDRSLLQRYGYPTVQLLLAAEKETQAQNLFSLLSTKVPMPYLSATTVFRNSQWMLQRDKVGEELRVFLAKDTNTPTAKALCNLESFLLSPSEETMLEPSTVETVAPYFSDGSVTLSGFLSNQLQKPDL